MRPGRRAGFEGGRARTLSLALAVAFALAAPMSGCAGAAQTEAREPSDAARLLLECEVEDASVWVDGSYVGEVGHLSGGIAVSPGTRRLEVRHDRYHTFYTQIALEPHERKTLEVHLARELR